MRIPVLKSILSAVSYLFCGICYSQMVSPDVKCVRVLPNGDVTLTWVIPPPGNFVSYHVDTSSNPFLIPFATYTTITPYTATTATHTSASANIKRMYYRVFTEDATPAFSTPSDTFSTIFLTVTGSGSGIANLAWNKISFRNIATSLNRYKIYREFPTGIWTLIDSTQNLLYTDVVDVCNKNNNNINYRIEIADNTGCTSVSNIAGGIFSDNTPPVSAPIDTVSVNSANLATISWNASPSPDVDSVVIYKWSPGWIIIDTVPAFSTFYTNLASTASTASELYSIAFLDSCQNISPLVSGHQTIHLSAAFNVCAATASLVWNKYINWSPSVTQYDVYVSVNGGNFSFLASTSSSDTNYVHTNLLIGNNYCYFIRAANGTKTSTSNRVCGTLNVSQPPLFNYNRYATVISDNSIKVTAHVDPAPSVKYFRIQRAMQPGGNFSIIKNNLLPPPGNTLTYIDNTVNSAVKSYVYKVEAMDSCGNVIISSNSDTTMLLKASAAPNFEVNLSWNDYGTWLGNVDHYEIYRSVDGVWNTTPFAISPHTGNGGAYTDNLAPFFANSRGNFSYYVEAVEGNGNTFGFADSSRSNIVKISEYPKIYVPNCFTPNNDGLNDVFIPVVGFIDSGNYSFAIYDNTGTPVFGTANPAEGWDGKKKGHICPEGVYVYVVSTQASNGNGSQISGTVTLIR